jgi:hypothetical protein
VRIVNSLKSISIALVGERVCYVECKSFHPRIFGKWSKYDIEPSARRLSVVRCCTYGYDGVGSPGSSSGHADADFPQFGKSNDARVSSFCDPGPCIFYCVYLAVHSQPRWLRCRVNPIFAVSQGF